MKHLLNATLVASLLSCITGAAHAEVVLNAAHFTSSQSSSAKSFLKFVEKINERGKGIIQIKVRGGPEVIPQNQLGEAQRSGLIDMINNPAGLYLNLVPEGEVFSATNLKPWELRANGGWKMINDIFAKKANAHILAHVDAGAGFNIFTIEAPKRRPDGQLDWKSLMIRTSPLQRDFVEALGAVSVVQPTGDIYTSLERGVVNANVFTVLNYPSYGWDRFTKYRIEPSFYQADVLISMNKKRWDKLPEDAKKILSEVAVEYERESYEANLKATQSEAAAMEADGQKVLKLEGKDLDRYRETAMKVSWERIAKRSPDHAEALKALFVK